MLMVFYYMNGWFCWCHMFFLKTFIHGSSFYCPFFAFDMFCPQGSMSQITKNEDQRCYWVEGLTCAKDHLLVPKVVCPMATAYPYASTWSFVRSFLSWRFVWQLAGAHWFWCTLNWQITAKLLDRIDCGYSIVICIDSSSYQWIF